jgi:IS30 family transposase
VASRQRCDAAPVARSPPEEREEISRGVAAGETMRTLARVLGRAPSTISREISRNGGSARYRASAPPVARNPRGHEMVQHARFSVATDVAVYICDPQSPWQRGTNENTDGLLRQYFPDGTDIKSYTQRDLDRVARELNTRPRKTLGFCGYLCRGCCTDRLNPPPLRINAPQRAQFYYHAV